MNTLISDSILSAGESAVSQNFISWSDILGGEKKQKYFQSILTFLRERQKAGTTIYPPKNEIFAAFAETPFERIRVVILGQDPYHGRGQAEGLCFSVKPGVPLPPSLENIFRELSGDLGIRKPNNGSLKKWAERGVFLLNAVLTVEDGRAGSHSGIGWERFTDKVIAELNDKKDHLVFMLWGAYAQKKGAFIDRQKHLVLEAPHPSPLSAHRGFLGCRHFSKANDWLVSQGLEPIDWTL
ncbi:MAG TPA: uracil-DNA glycosylase [Oligoflexia bacterium]|nr:uracil-DNA glycosylase [Oligoflexia bacterium]HMP27449.1 uracil-DNA glycosylase [Oligoflexia bacterium]